MGQWIELAAGDGHRFAAWQSAPDGAARGAVVVVQEIFGVNSHIRQVADGFAADGYLAIAPALFDRVEKDVQLGYTSADVTRGRELKSGVALADSLADLAAAIQAGIGAGRVGVVGYCWGGLLTWNVAAAVSGLACAVCYYGGGILDTKVRPACPVLLHFGEHDAMLPVDRVRAFAAAHSDHLVHIYAADHGFNCDQRGSYDAPGAALARERTLAFFREHIG